MDSRILPRDFPSKKTAARQMKSPLILHNALMNKKDKIRSLKSCHRSACKLQAHGT